jgi:ribosomal protein S18 acetylase RimI-like enzyme
MITYLYSADGIAPEQLEGFFVGWPNPPSAEAHLKLLKNSSEVVLARDGETGKMVGFINAITDGVLCAYIPLLEVVPAYQGRGIGRELTRLMLARLERFYMVDLLCDPEVQPFYEAHGLRPATGMMFRNYEAQSGVTDG